jgi:hypothetical protein
MHPVGIRPHLSPIFTCVIPLFISLIYSTFCPVSTDSSDGPYKDQIVIDN